MLWISEASCACVCESFPVTSVERPQAPDLIPFVRLCLVCLCCASHQHVRRNQHTAPRCFDFFLEPPGEPSWSCWGGGAGEPQLLSDVNAAQTLCVCGHSPPDRSNQLMGVLTLG